MQFATLDVSSVLAAQTNAMYARTITTSLTIYPLALQHLKVIQLHALIVDQSQILSGALPEIINAEALVLSISISK